MVCLQGDPVWLHLVWRSFLRKSRHGLPNASSVDAGRTRPTQNGDQMRKILSAAAAGTLAIGLALATAAPAHAESGSGYATCSVTYSWTYANSNAQIKHFHQHSNEWAYVYKPAGVSSWKKWWSPGAVFMTLETTTGGFSGEVYGCKE